MPIFHRKEKRLPGIHSERSWERKQVLRFTASINPPWFPDDRKPVWSLRFYDVVNLKLRNEILANFINFLGIILASKIKKKKLRDNSDISWHSRFFETFENILGHFDTIIDIYRQLWIFWDILEHFEIFFDTSWDI